jgi:hypothetical protein
VAPGGDSQSTRGVPRKGGRQRRLMKIPFRNERVERLHWMLALPFIGPAGEYLMNRSEGALLRCSALPYRPFHRCWRVAETG